MARLIALGLALLASGGAPTPAAAQDAAAGPSGDAAAAGDEQLTLPPVIRAMPGDVRLEPPPEDREDGLHVEVTGGQTDWRLPDLGTSLREEEETRDPDQRIEARLAPLFDPEKEDPTHETAPVVDVLRDVGFIRIFEIRIGPKDD